MIEPIGIVTVAVGMLCLFAGMKARIVVLAFSTLLGASAAMLIGAANIQPAHLLLLIVAASVFTQNREATLALHALRPGQPAFWFACLVLYGVASAYLLPRLFAGTSEIIPLGMTAYDDTGSTVPLGPVSSNLTQSIYLAANLLCFAVTVAVASTPAGFQAVLSGLLACAIGNIVFAVLDLGTYFTGTQEILSFIRNARYTLHIDVEVAGIKRTVGSFTEASQFARTTLGTSAFAGTLWLCGYRPLLTGWVAAISLLMLLASTSTTGVVGAPFVALMLYGTALMRCGVHRDRRFSSMAVLLAPVAGLMALVVLALDRGLASFFMDYLNMTVLDKPSTDSGIERGSWNTFALKNFFDSWGFGVGLGTMRASSFALAILGSVGIPGALLYLAFLTTALLPKRTPPLSLASDIQLAARNACLGLIVGDLLVGPVLDQGLYFQMLAGLCAARPMAASQAFQASFARRSFA